jgi:hypothetical protein
MKSDTNKHVAQLTFIFFIGFISCCLRWLHMPGDCQSYSEKGGIKPGSGSILKLLFLQKYLKHNFKM